MMRACDDIILRTIELAQHMLDLADEGDSAREDTGCGVLYGVLRDSAFKIRHMAEAERETHRRKGWGR